MAGNPDFDVFKLPEEHDELRAVLRDLCEKEIAPYAADVDEKPRFPDEALKALKMAQYKFPIRTKIVTRYEAGSGE